MLGQNQFSNLQKCWVKTRKQETKDPNCTSAKPHNIEATFEDDRQLTANDYIQEQKLISTKKEKISEDCGLKLNKILSYDEKSQYTRTTKPV